MAEQTFQGTVNAFQQRVETGTQQRPIIVWSFRLQRTDKEGKPLPKVAVEMRGRTFSGVISTGDVVSFKAVLNKEQMATPNLVNNLTTNSQVSTSSKNVSYLVTVLILLSMPIIIALLIMSRSH